MTSLQAPFAAPYADCPSGVRIHGSSTLKLNAARRATEILANVAY